MANVIITGHGGYATAVRRSLTMLTGQTGGMAFVDFDETDDLDSLTAALRAAADSFGPEADLLFLADLAGGSPFRQCAMLCAGHPGWIFAAALLSGFGYYQLHSALLFQITQRAPEARSLALALSVSLFFVGQSVGVSAAGWLVDQGRITLVFAIAALGMPLLGVAAGRQIRPA